MTGNEIEGEGLVKLFTAEGKVETYSIDEKVTMNDSALPGGFEIKNLITKLKETTEDLIVYSLNSEGTVKDISFALPFDTDEKNNENKFVYVKQSSATAEAYSGYSFGGVSVDGAVCFMYNRAITSPHYNGF